MGKRYRVFHCPIEIAGQMGALVGGLRSLGHKAIGYNTFHSYLNYQDHIINTDLETVILKYQSEKHKYKIFHFHFGTSLYHDFHDLMELKQMGKKLVMHHWGNDVRFQKKAKKLSPFLLDPCNPYSDDEMKRRLKIISSFVPTTIIQDMELYDYIKKYYKNIFVLPLAFDVSAIKPRYPKIDKKIPLIIHAPTQPSFKGTSTIEATLDALKQNGYEFKYKRIEKMSHAEAMKYYKRADIVIDQILVGTYGRFSVEAMALGKPVVVHIRDDLSDKYPAELPFVQANPSTLYQALVPLLTDANLRYKIGEKSRKYAEQVHDTPIVIQKLLEIYRFVEKT